MIDNETYLTPKQIVKELDKYIIGQKDAKKNVAIALRNRWRRMKTKPEIQQEITPNNILMIGPTGVGKTEIARRLAKLADAPFTKVEASKFTEVGYVGRDVESMVRDLVDQSVNIVKAGKKEEVKQKAAEIVEEIILDALIPPLKKPAHKPQTSPTVHQQAGLSINLTSGHISSGADIANQKAGKQAESRSQPEQNSELAGDNMPKNDYELNEKTREKFREKIKSGELDDRKIEINIQQNSAAGIGVIGPAGGIDEVSMMNIQEMIGGMLPKRAKKRKLKIAEARKILLEEETAKLIDMDEVKEEAISKAENTGIIFIDEIDKVASRSSGSGGPDVSREGVQRDLLPIVEGSTVNTKYGVVKTDHILFIAAGAFYVSKPSDLIPELQGRFPIRVELDNLTKDDFCKILKYPKNALTKQYEALLGSEDVELRFTDEAIDMIAEMAFEINSKLENIGARRLQTVMSQLLNDILFDVPDTISQNAKILITKEMVEEKLSEMVKDKDVSQYIL
ncbi:MAG: ATP-dependent protease ATPase subunit HslU [Bacteroidetes bacterium]|nr:ATP-dependent protease ATPase subunit HslU [Bacteroidota bacterium]